MKTPGRGRRSWLMMVTTLALCACAPASVESTATSTPPATVSTSGRPAAPEGFSWKEIPDIKASFLMPEGWHYTEAVKGNTFGFYMTRENFLDGGTFDTGLTVNVIRGDGSTDPVDGARRFVERMLERNEELESWEIGSGGFKGFGCRTRTPAEAENGSRIMHTLAMGNASTGTVYLMWFESREETWPDAWKIGEKVLDQFVLDEGY